MLYYVLAFAVGAIISGLIVYIIQEKQRQQLELQMIQQVKEAYERGRQEAVQSDDSEFGEMLHKAASAATIIGLLG